VAVSRSHHLWFLMFILLLAGLGKGSLAEEALPAQEREQASLAVTRTVLGILVLQDALRQQRQAALLFIDCDHFKDINDGLGHAAGDKVLTEVASRIRRHLRESDLVARLGGDEFAALIYPLPQAKDALRIADAVLHGMDAPIVLNDGDSVSTSLSIGIALYPQHGRSAEHLLHSADVAMYLAKRAGRGSLRLASASEP